MSEAGRPAQDPNLHRLVFFSDGVFAIAITLLAIELHTPAGWDGRLASLWTHEWPMFAAFAISFFAIGAFWNAHRRTFSQMRRYSTGVFILNLLLLALIVLMPFSTSLVYREGPIGDRLLIYFGLLAGTGLMQTLLWGYAAFVADVIHEQVPRRQRVLAFLSMLLPVVVAIASLLAVGHGAWAWIAVAVLAFGLRGSHVWLARRSR